MSISALFSRRRLLLALLLSPLLLSAQAHADTAKRLRIGITLHPYYSYVANIVGDKADVVPLIPAGFNPHAYEPRAEDIKRIGTLDVIVLNGVGHDDFADRMIEASEKPQIALIEANENVPLLAATGIAARGAGKVVNPHTFLSISASIAQVNNIARELGKLDPANARLYTTNARAYGKRLRQIRADAPARVWPGGHGRGRAGPRDRTEPEPVEKDHRPTARAGCEGDLLGTGLPVDLCRNHPA